MSAIGRTQILGQYKRFLRVAEQWPTQTDRYERGLAGLIRHAAYGGYRDHRGETKRKKITALYEDGERELRCLNLLISDALVDKYGAYPEGIIPEKYRDRSLLSVRSQVKYSTSRDNPLERVALWYLTSNDKGKKEEFAKAIKKDASS